MVARLQAAAPTAVPPARKREGARSSGRRGRVPYHNQTTDFTCGAASLLMAMRALDPGTDFSRTHELLLWREATTIFKGGPGHGGCGATGLALAARRRGFDVEAWVNHKGTLLGSRPKDKDRAKVMSLLQQADLAGMKRLNIPYRIAARSIADLRGDIAAGAIPIVLVSMEYIHQDPTAHWVVVSSIDDQTATVNDPRIPQGRTRRAMTDLAVPHEAFRAMTALGRRRELATVLLRRR